MTLYQLARVFAKRRVRLKKHYNYHVKSYEKCENEHDWSLHMHYSIKLKDLKEIWNAIKEAHNEHL